MREGQKKETMNKWQNNSITIGEKRKINEKEEMILGAHDIMIRTINIAKNEDLFSLKIIW